MTQDEYVAQAAQYRDLALTWFAERTPMKDERFKCVLGGLEYECDVVGICPINRTYLGRSVSPDCGAVLKGAIIHFDRNSMALPPR